MISAVLFVNQKGEVVISRMYRDGFSRVVADTFRSQVIASKEVRFSRARARAGHARSGRPRGRANEIGACALTRFFFVRPRSCHRRAARR